MATTIKQVAKLASVSAATVSYVLNGTGTVTEATRLRVLEAVTLLNYQPSHAARSMRGASALPERRRKSPSASSRPSRPKYFCSR